MFQTLETYSNNRLTPVQFPEQARWTAGVFGASLTLAAGTVIGKKTADSKLYAYASGNADGTQVAVGLVVYDIKTDASGFVYFVSGATAAAATSTTPAFETAPYYISGTFDTADLTGWDATALSTIKAATLPSGFIRIP